MIIYTLRKHITNFEDETPSNFIPALRGITSRGNIAASWQINSPGNSGVYTSSIIFQPGCHHQLDARLKLCLAHVSLILCKYFPENTGRCRSIFES